MNVGNYSLWSVAWRFCVTHKELELFSNICDFTTQFYVILRHGSSEWLESSIKSDLDMRFAIWSLDLAFHNFSFFKHSFQCKSGLFKKVPHLLISWFGKIKFWCPWLLFFTCELCRRPSLIRLICSYFLSFRVQSLFSWRPGDMSNPQPSFFSFKSIIENSKMKVRIS